MYIVAFFKSDFGSKRSCQRARLGTYKTHSFLLISQFKPLKVKCNIGGQKSAKECHVLFEWPHMTKNQIIISFNFLAAAQLQNL